MLEAPNILIQDKDRSQYTCLQSSLSKLVVVVLQQRFDALLWSGAMRLKVNY
jgi:hypothetical protein